MAGHIDRNPNQDKLSRLRDELPAGLPVGAAWLRKKGYYRQLLGHYLASGWLESPAHGVYRRPVPAVGDNPAPVIKWQHVICSLQNLLQLPVHVGGLSALEIQGYGHFVRMGGAMTVHLYSQARLPSWLQRLSLKDDFVVHRKSLFGDEGRGLNNAAVNAANDRLRETEDLRIGMKQIEWGEHDLPLTYSSAERAILEFLDEVPQRESVGHANLLMQGLRTLSPERLKLLLSKCGSIKVKRLFFALAEHNRQPWLRHLDVEAFDLGRGKRMIVRGGRLHPKYLITLPENIDDSA